MSEGQKVRRDLKYSNESQKIYGNEGIEEILHICGKQRFMCYREDVQLIMDMQCIEGYCLTIHNVFVWGIIQGIRKERARKKSK